MTSLPIRAHTIGRSLLTSIETLLLDNESPARLTHRSRIFRRSDGRNPLRFRVLTSFWIDY